MEPSKVTEISENPVPQEKTKRSRTIYTAQQLLELEKAFNKNNYIDAEKRTALANLLNLKDQKIKTWFQNRRAREKKESKGQNKLNTRLDSFKKLSEINYQKSPKIDEKSAGFLLFGEPSNDIVGNDFEYKSLSLESILPCQVEELFKANLETTIENFNRFEL